MGKKPDEIKIDGIVIKDHKTVSFTTAFLIGVICFVSGVLAYKYIFMILPQHPGCVQIAVKTPDGNPVPNVKVNIYIAILINETGTEVASGATGPGGKVKFCDVFQPYKRYIAIVIDEYGNELWVESFTTNEKATADFPIIVRQEYT